MGMAPGGAQEPGAAAGRADLPQRHAGHASAGTPGPGSPTPAAERAAARAGHRQPRTCARPTSAGRSRTLSGGNQQKVVVGRWLLGRHAELLLLDEPTRGVDVGARAELYGVIRRLADDGVGVLLVSSEVPEVLGLADRVLVMREGRLIHEAPPTDLDEDTVLDLVMAGSLLEGGERHERASPRRAASESGHRRPPRRGLVARGRAASRSGATSAWSACWSLLLVVGAITRPDIFLDFDRLWATR